MRTSAPQAPRRTLRRPHNAAGYPRPLLLGPTLPGRAPTRPCRVTGPAAGGRQGTPPYSQAQVPSPARPPARAPEGRRAGRTLAGEFDPNPARRERYRETHLSPYAGLSRSPRPARRQRNPSHAGLKGRRRASFTPRGRARYTGRPASTPVGAPSVNKSYSPGGELTPIRVSVQKFGRGSVASDTGSSHRASGWFWTCRSG